MKKPARIAFMGTPEFAVASLGAILMSGYEVAAVVTAPDRPAGRGRKISKSAVALFAEENELNILQPLSLKDPGFIRELQLLSPDVIIVVAFRMLPEIVWKIPKLGTFNLHASLLPQYRGAAPINHVLINGESITGVTTFLIDKAIDTGNILLREEVHISATENAGELHDRLLRTGAALVVRTIEGLLSGNLKPRPQSDFIKDGTILKEAPKIYPADCFLNFRLGAQEVYNLIRGLSPYPGSRITIDNRGTLFQLKILAGEYMLSSHDRSPGTIDCDGSTYIRIACKDGFVNITSLQAEGKKAMNTTDFLRGNSTEGWKVAINHQV